MLKLQKRWQITKYFLVFSYLFVRLYGLPNRVFQWPPPVRGWTGPPGAGSPTLSSYWKNNVRYYETGAWGCAIQAALRLFGLRSAVKKWWGLRPKMPYIPFQSRMACS